jgi:hypothetical protein
MATSIDAATAALVASGVSAAAAIIAQVIVQTSAANREREARELREERARAVVDGHLGALEPYLVQQVASGTIWVVERFERRLAPLQRLIDDRTTLLDLRPIAIDAIIALVGTLELELDNMRILLDQYDRDYKSATDGEQKAHAGDHLRMCLQALFSGSSERLTQARSYLTPESHAWSLLRLKPFALLDSARDAMDFLERHAARRASRTGADPLPDHLEHEQR